MRYLVLISVSLFAPARQAGDSNQAALCDRCTMIPYCPAAPACMNVDAPAETTATVN